MEWNHVVWILTIFAYKYYSTNYSVRRQGAHTWRVKKTGTYKIFSSFQMKINIILNLMENYSL